MAGSGRPCRSYQAPRAGAAGTPRPAPGAAARTAASPGTAGGSGTTRRRGPAGPRTGCGAPLRPAGPPIRCCRAARRTAARTSAPEPRSGAESGRCRRLGRQQLVPEVVGDVRRRRRRWSRAAARPGCRGNPAGRRARRDRCRRPAFGAPPTARTAPARSAVRPRRAAAGSRPRRSELLGAELRAPPFGPQGGQPRGPAGRGTRGHLEPRGRGSISPRIRAERVREYVLHVVEDEKAGRGSSRSARTSRPAASPPPVAESSRASRRSAAGIGTAAATRAAMWPRAGRVASEARG